MLRRGVYRTAPVVLMVLIAFILLALQSTVRRSIGAEVYGINHTMGQAVFLSCNRHDGDQNYWDVIATTVEQRLNGSVAKQMGQCISRRPVDALIWTGDAVYADRTVILRKTPPPLDLKAAQAKFVHQANAPQYVAFRHTCVAKRKRTNIPSSSEEVGKRVEGEGEGEEHRVIGVWDDHDMGKNDGGAEFSDKDAMQQFYLDFLGVPRTDPRRKRQGVYHFEAVPVELLSSTAGSDTAATAAVNVMKHFYDNAFCFLLLDARYFRDPSNATRSGNMLGETQWQWLEERLRDDVAGRNPATGRERCALTVVANGVQIMLDEKVSESWAAFPRSRDRLFALLRQFRTDRVIFMSGDVHLGEIGMDTRKAAMRTLGYPIIEATSSGLTHSTASFVALPTILTSLFPSRRRVGVYVERNFGVLKLTANSKARFELSETSAHEERREQFERDVNASILIHSIPENGAVALHLTLPLSALTHKSGCQLYKAKANEYGWIEDATLAKQQECETMFRQERDERGAGIPDRHYPPTYPTPFVTYVMQSVQGQVWPDCTLLQVLFRFLLATFLLLIFVGAISVALCCQCYKNRKAKKA
ncbi:hypothetical protein, conserved [Trypanosoma brucei brucei TREU927]|uniref:PhoD-like phosphatase metallophosphatase domain-containing protein n=1 Tax=Trypanosoma brucei brucei (strain 927/4 GUTat10.1) TaxID=185431 RepID=Q388T8_TRYB2|nr:hypothetical protein, conserved [Trypanosoma brucei brucei TREU927]EAN78682.1 hypothetical protein, conserved [Trypanosoma brucei brucei TREU927]